MSHDRRLSLQLWIVLNRAVDAMDRPLRRQVEGHGLSMKAFAVLEVLASKGPLPIGDVAEKVLLTSGSMTYVIDQLEDDGLLERRRCPDDRRVCYVALTDAGQDRVDAIFPEHAALIQRLMRGLSVEEKETAYHLLRRLSQTAPEQAPSSSTP